MMAMVAKVVRSDSLAVGWVYHLFNSAVIGGIFGVLLAPTSRAYGAGVVWGALYGVAWWVLGGLVLMPVLLGMPPLAPVTMPPMRPVALGSLMGHVLFGVVLGVGFLAISGRRSGEEAAPMGRVA